MQARSVLLLRRDWHMIQKEAGKYVGVSVKPSSSNSLLEWEGEVRGVHGSMWDGAVFQVSSNYPSLRAHISNLFFPSLSFSLSLSLSFSLFLIYKKYIFKSLYLKHLSSLSIYKKEDILEQSLDVCPRLLLFSVFIQKSAQSIKPDRKLWGQWEESI